MRAKQNIIVGKKKTTNKNAIYLSNTGNNIDTIYHISDIHISRFEDRHKEYEQVFERLTEYVAQDTNNALIVITGDIMHEKNMLSPAQLVLANKFFIMLSNLLPCIVIIGNHDVSPYGNTIDSLTPILANINTKNAIHLLLENKNYYYNNLIFGVTTMDSTVVTQCNDKTKIRIGLYHGMIANAKLENGYEILDKPLFTLDDFKQHYDYIMLGDIHKHMMLDDKSAYAGSLIQQKISEDLTEHGVIKWNLVNRIHEFKQIKNDWGFIKVKVNQNGIVGNPLAILPKYPIVKIEYDGIPMSKAEEVMIMLRDQHNAKCTLVRKVNNQMNITFGSDINKTNIADVNGNDVVIKLVKDFIENTNKYDIETKATICNKINNMLMALGHKYNNTTKKMTLKKLKFDNFFNFGLENEIDYTKMMGVVEVAGNSFAGKTTVVQDAFTYALFGRSYRGDKYDVINIDSKSMSTDIEFDINGNTYHIMRKRVPQGSRKSRDSSEIVYLFKNDVNISKENIIKTNEEITNIICPYDDFVNIAIMGQRNNNNFIDLSDVDKKQMICNFFKLDVFNNIVSEAKSQICKINYFLANLRGKTPSGSKKNNAFDKNKNIAELRSKIKGFEIEYNDELHALGELVKQHDNNNEKLIEYKIKCGNQTTDICIDIENAGIKLAQKQAKLKQYNDELAMLLTTKMGIENRLVAMGDIETLYQSFVVDNQKEIETLTEQLEQLLTQRIPIDTNNFDDYDVNYLKRNIAILENDIVNMYKQIIVLRKPRNMNKILETTQKLNDAHKLLFQENERLTHEQSIVSAKYEKLKNHNYDPDCTYCVSYPITQDKIECEHKMTELDKALSENKQEIKRNLANIKKCDKQYISVSHYNKVSKQNEEIRENITKMQTEINVCKKDLDTSNKKLDIENTNANIDKKIVQTKQEICNIKQRTFDGYGEYKKLLNEKTILADKINDLYVNIGNVSNDIICVQQDIDTYNENKNKICYVECKSKCDELNKLIGDKRTNINKMNDDLIKLRIELATAEQTAEEYLAKQNEKELLEEIVSVIDKDGLIDNILSNTIVPKMESDLNQLLEQFIGFKVAISYHNGRFKFDKIIGGNKVISICTSSATEKILLDICIKLVLEQYNNHLKTGFIVMDEVFNCLDDCNIDKLPLLFDIMKRQYGIVIIVSHDIRVKKLVDICIPVVKKDDSSYIKF